MVKKQSPAELQETIQKLKAIIEDLEQQPTQKKIHGGVMGRRKIEQVWSALPTEPHLAMTITEASQKLGINESVVQRALYILLAEKRVVRNPREDGGKGRAPWEYYRLDIPSPEPIESKQPRFDMESLWAVIPESEGKAMTIRDLAIAMDGNPITVRQKIQMLEAAGKVIPVPSLNERNQSVTKYYRK